MQIIWRYLNSNFKLSFFIFLLLLGLVNYWGSFRNPFYLDDQAIYLNTKTQNSRFALDIFNPHAINLSGSKHNDGYSLYYRPLHLLSCHIEASFFGNNTVYYQILSLLLFIISCQSILLFLYSFTSNRFLASTASILYLLHPFNGLCVNYKTAFVFSLLIIFLNLTMIYVHKIYRKQINFKLNELFLYLLLYFFALLFNELAFIFPIILFIYYIFVRKTNYRDLVIPGGFLSVTFVYLLWRFLFPISPGGPLGAIFGYKLSWYEFCAAYARLIRWVIGKLIYPENIFLQWATYVDKPMASHWIWVFAFYIFISLFFLCFFRKRSKILAFFWLMFIVGFLISAPATYNYLGSGFLYFEPHWIFYTNIGLFALVGWMLDKTRAVVIWLPYLLVGSISIFLIFFSFKQNKLYNNPNEYDLQWSRETPGFYIPNIFVCQDLFMQGEFDKAFSCFQPWTDSLMQATVNSELAKLYYLKKDYKKSKEFLKKVLLSDQGSLVAYEGLADIAYQEGDFRTAIDYLNIAQQYDGSARELFILRRHIYEKEMKYKEIIRSVDAVKSHDL